MWLNIRTQHGKMFQIKVIIYSLMKMKCCVYYAMYNCLYDRLFYRNLINANLNLHIFDLYCTNMDQNYIRMTTFNVGLKHQI
jgi:hypothetical protein